MTTKEWMDRITSDLKGADFNKKMVWKTREGFDVLPFYRREDLEGLRHADGFSSLLLRKDEPGSDKVTGNGKANESWLVRQDIKVTDYQTANRRALSLLMKGVNSIGFVIADPESVNEENFTLLLKDINPEWIEINFLSEGKAREIVALFIKICSAGGYDLSKTRGAVEADPLGRLMINGKLCTTVRAGFDYLASLTSDTLILPHYRNIDIKGSDFINAGSDSVQELGFSIAMAVEYISQLSVRGINPEEVAKKIRFTFGIGSDYFMEIARLRAARLLWNIIASGYKPVNAGSFRMEIHCVTSTWNATVYDPYVNMLRTQTEAMSAVIGGTDSLTVNPFDIGYSEPDEFSDRIARNQQLILKEEAYFDKVSDPAAGSYYIEKLTSLVAESAWKLFLSIEEMGGFIAALRSGIIQNQISDSAAKRRWDVSRRKEVLLGTNQYPNPDETLAPELEPVFTTSAVKNVKKGLVVEPVQLFRGSEEFERIRMTVEKASKRPVVFLLQIGNSVMRKARAQFSSGFFGCAGYRIIDNTVTDNVDKGVKAALDANADIVVICSSDEEYPMYAPEISGRLKGRAHVVVAGNPESMDDLRSKGIKNFISIRSDVTETLRYYNKLLGI